MKNYSCSHFKNQIKPFFHKLSYISLYLDRAGREQLSGYSLLGPGFSPVGLAQNVWVGKFMIRSAAVEFSLRVVKYFVLYANFPHFKTQTCVPSDE